MPFTYFILPSAFVLWAVYRLSKVGRRPKGLPPGPPTIPILGNLHQMPSEHQYIQLTKWAKEYGPIYSLMLGTTVMIVLSSDQAVKDLLDKRSNIYSSRPHMHIGQAIGSGGDRMLMLEYGPKWRMIRKVTQKILNINNAKSYIPYQDLESKQMLNDTLDSPDDIREHGRRYASSLTASMVFGWRWQTIDDPLLQRFFHGFDTFAEMNQAAGTALVDFFPILQNLPEFLSPAVRRARYLHKREEALYKSFYLPAKEAAESKTQARHCFSTELQALQQVEGIDDHLATYTTGTMFEAGSDTTSSEIYGFVQAMLLYPEAQRKAQAELDTVIGHDRLPTCDDMPNLPYIRCCIKETCRWMPTAILGAVPHAVIQDDEYMGYHIPKGAGVMMNVWGIHRDPDRYEQPEKFMPERYEGDETSLADSAANPDVKKRDQFGFGAGRRLCQGMHLAERSLFLGLSRLLWAFDIKPKVDENGVPKLPVQDVFHGGFVVLPEKFEVSITPRSEKKVQIIREAWNIAKENLDGETAQWKVNPLQAKS